jgi:hypothetical protein
MTGGRELNSSHGCGLKVDGFVRAPLTRNCVLMGGYQIGEPLPWDLVGKVFVDEPGGAELVEEDGAGSNLANWKSGGSARHGGCLFPHRISTNSYVGG